MWFCHGTDTLSVSSVTGLVKNMTEMSSHETQEQKLPRVSSPFWDGPHQPILRLEDGSLKTVVAFTHCTRDLEASSLRVSSAVVGGRWC